MAKRIFVGNLPFSATDQSLVDAFAQYGEVASAKIVTDRMSGRSRGFGFVEMNDDTQAQSAIDALNGADYEGRAITVNEAREPEARGPGGGGGYRGGRGRDGGGRPGGGGGYRGGRGRDGGGGGGYRGGDRGGNRF